MTGDIMSIVNIKDNRSMAVDLFSSVTIGTYYTLKNSNVLYVKIDRKEAYCLTYKRVSHPNAEWKIDVARGVNIEIF